MCLAVIGVIEKLDGESCEVRVAGVTRRVGLQLLSEEKLAVGDHLVLQFGLAMAKLTAEEAAETEAAMEELRANSAMDPRFTDG